MTDLPLTLFDLGVLGVVVLSALLALVRGATREALTVAAWLGAFAVAWYGFAGASAFARQTIEEGWLADVAALAVVFLIPLILFKAVSAVLAERVRGSRLGPLDRWVGAGFGVARGVVLVCLAYLGLSMVITPDRHPAWVQDAASLPYVQRGAELLQRLVPPGAAEAEPDTALGEGKEAGRPT